MKISKSQKKEGARKKEAQNLKIGFKNELEL